MTISVFNSRQTQKSSSKSRKGAWSVGKADQAVRISQPGWWRDNISQQLQRTVRNFSQNNSHGRKERSPLVSSLERRP